MKNNKPTILSIQSSVAYGHVGNSAAVFPLQRLGIEVWPVLTVHFSNHTGYGDWRGPVLPASDIAEVIAGIEMRGVMGRCDAILSGYQGDVSLGNVIIDAVDRVRHLNPKAVYCCDPVMGDVGRGFFVRPGLPEFIRDRAVPRSDIITPNQFELEYLTGRDVATLDDALAAAQAARALGPELVLLTSLRRQDGPNQNVEMLAVGPGGAWLCSVPLLPVSVNGAGDVTAALFLAHYLIDRDPAAALWKTTSTIHTILEHTHLTGSREIELIAAQGSIADPDMRFAAEKVA